TAAARVAAVSSAVAEGAAGLAEVEAAGVGSLDVAGGTTAVAMTSTASTHTSPMAPKNALLILCFISFVLLLCFISFVLSSHPQAPCRLPRLPASHRQM